MVHDEYNFTPPPIPGKPRTAFGASGRCRREEAVLLHRLRRWRLRNCWPTAWAVPGWRPRARRGRAGGDVMGQAGFGEPRRYGEVSVHRPQPGRMPSAIPERAERIAQGRTSIILADPIADAEKEAVNSVPSRPWSTPRTADSHRGYGFVQMSEGGTARPSSRVDSRARSSGGLRTVALGSPRADGADHTPRSVLARPSRLGLVP